MSEYRYRTPPHRPVLRADRRSIATRHSNSRNAAGRQPGGRNHAAAARIRQKKTRRTLSRFLFLAAGSLALCLAAADLALGRQTSNPFQDTRNIVNISSEASDGSPAAAEYLASHKGDLPSDLQKLLSLNEETLDYVKGYPDRDGYTDIAIDLNDDFTKGQVPLLMQWDRRWGYNSYGNEMIGLAGCGPLCLEMAYLYFTGDTETTPREMAAFAYDNGFYTSSGTSWSLWTQGAEMLGLRGAELPLDENRMYRALDEGGLIVCSMGPGDFTTAGHFVLIRGYDENGFYVNDPNRRSTSGKQWDYETLKCQIKNLWELKPA